MYNKTELNRKCRKEFYMFFYRYDNDDPIGVNYCNKEHIPYINDLKISDFFTEEDTKITITIVTSNPGIVIGYHGCLIDGIRKFLNETFSKDYNISKEIVIKLVENTMWSKLYTEVKKEDEKPYVY